VFVYAQLKPMSHEPARSLPSIAASSEASCVCSPRCCAISWSTEMPAWTSDVSERFGGMFVRNRVDARACTPAPVARAAGGLFASPESTVRRSRNGSSGFIAAGNENAAPSSAGVHSCITIPLGT
jgi:hypothetical protein